MLATDNDYATKTKEGLSTCIDSVDKNFFSRRRVSFVTMIERDVKKMEERRREKKGAWLQNINAKPIGTKRRENIVTLDTERKFKKKKKKKKSTLI